VASLSRFRSKHEQRDTIAQLAAGKLDIVIGTHRLLSRDLHFRNLGLLIIDEERASVSPTRTPQGDALAVECHPDATPIPRTLQDGHECMREISIIATRR